MFGNHKRLLLFIRMTLIEISWIVSLHLIFFLFFYSGEWQLRVLIAIAGFITVFAIYFSYVFLSLSKVLKSDPSLIERFQSLSGKSLIKLAKEKIRAL